MEVVYNNISGQELIVLDTLQLKSEHKLDMPENAKKIMSVTCNLTGQNTTVKGADLIFTGNLCFRMIFINEFEKYDSKDVIEPIEKKLAVKDITETNSVFGAVNITNSQWSLQDSSVVVTNILQMVVKGVKKQETQMVSDLTGDVEVRHAEHKILTFNLPLHDQFEIEENIDLDKNCEGVLGVDTNAQIKDIAAADGKVTVKGVIAVNVIGVKTSENGSVPYNTVHEVDFAKSVIASGVTSEDMACGEIFVNAVKMHIENNNKGSILVLEIELHFNGCSYVYRTFNTMIDAISFDKELTFETSEYNYVEMLPQVNTTVDLESNINLPANTPYITRVLAVDGVSVNNLQVTPADGKTMFEGIITANVLLENEEHVVSNLVAEVPFQTHVRMDNMESDQMVDAVLTPLTLNVKARRGVELLIDAQFGVSVRSSCKKSLPIVTAVQIGNDKTEDDSAIRIYIIGEKENLWDLAKRTNLGCAELLKQNPNLENGCTPNERIVVYRHDNISL